MKLLRKKWKFYFLLKMIDQNILFSSLMRLDKDLIFIQ